ncbi:MAG: hypothetical protein ABIA75_06020 [Candidatus Neomarinimicrobiota bacterium]
MSDDIKTVIVLGAGASNDIGFPIGSELLNSITAKYRNSEYLELVKRILWNNRDIITVTFAQSVPSDILHLLKRGDSFEYWRDNSLDLTSWTNKLSAINSIDDFLFHRKEYSIYAKLGILAALSNHEQEDFFLPNEQGVIRRTWYNDLWETLRYACNSLSDLKKKLERLIIINFNYDRSLEFFLSSRIIDLFESEVNKENINPVSLIHVYYVYGSIGSLVTSDDGYNKYNPIDFEKIPTWANKYKLRSWTSYGGEPEDAGELSLYDHYLLRIALTIKTYDELPVQEKITQIRDELTKANYLYFFGFAFHSQNMSILNPNDKLYDYKYVSGTCYKMSTLQFKNSISSIKGKFLIQGLEPQLYPIKIDDFIKEHGITI